MRRSGIRGGIVLAGLAALFAGCGSSQMPTQKPVSTLAIGVEDFGAQTEFTASKFVKAGVVKMHFTNGSRSTHSAQLVRFDPGHTVEATLTGLRTWMNRKPLAPWIHLAGGFGPIRANTAASGVGRLDPGAYIAVDLEAKGTPVYATFDVRGNAGAKTASPSQGTVRAVDYSFTASGLRQGRSTPLFDNSGKEPHQIVAARLKKGATVADVRRYARDHSGREPAYVSGAPRTAFIDSGERQVVQLDLRAGRYALICFAHDRKGGPAHILKGMASPTVVR